MSVFQYRLKLVKKQTPDPPALATPGAVRPQTAAPEAAGTQDDSQSRKPGSSRGDRVLRILLAVLGLVSFLCVLGVGFLIISPSSLPDSLRAACVSERESRHENGIEDKDENGLPDFPTSTQSDTDNRKCEAQQIPTELLICASALTVFFFLGISIHFFRGLKFEGGGVKLEVAPTQLGVDTARATAAAVAQLKVPD